MRESVAPNQPEISSPKLPTPTLNCRYTSDGINFDFHRLLQVYNPDPKPPSHNPQQPLTPQPPTPTHTTPNPTVPQALEDEGVLTREVQPPCKTSHPNQSNQPRALVSSRIFKIQNHSPQPYTINPKLRSYPSARAAKNRRKHQRLRLQKVIPKPKPLTQTPNSKFPSPNLNLQPVAAQTPKSAASSSAKPQTPIPKAGTPNPKPQTSNSNPESTNVE
jgi:collagen type IV alpha